MGRAGAVTCRDEHLTPALPLAQGHILLTPSISGTRDLHKCSGDFCRGRIFFLWTNILRCAPKHIPFMGRGLLRQEGRLLAQTSAAPPN